MWIIVNNIVNVNIMGYCVENVIFVEYVYKGQGEIVLLLVMVEVWEMVFMQGGLFKIGGMFDLVIEGDGFFLI